MYLRISVLNLAAIILLVTSGCGPSPEERIARSIAEHNESNIQRLHSCYSAFMDRNRMKGPEDEEEFKKFIHSPDIVKLLEKLLNVNSSELDSMFISERDGKPFKIKYGAKGIGEHAVIFEDTGVEGKRLVAYGKARELDSAEYDRLWTSDKTLVAGPSFSGEGP